MNDNAGNCPCCLLAFENILRRPRNLPCGHTFCTPCINGLKNQGQVACPTCRVVHTVPRANQFPINYALETYIESVREASQNGAAGLSRPIRFLLQEQEAKVLAAIRTCQEVQMQLDQYQTTLVDWGERQQNLEDRLQALLDQSKDARVLVRQEKSKVVTKKEQVQQEEQKLHTLLQTLRTLTTEQEVGVASVDVARCTNEERQRIEECRMFPDVHTVTTINKVRDVSSAALEAATTVQSTQETVGAPAGAERDPDLLAAPDSSITDRLKALLTPTMKAEDLRSLTQTARSLLQAGLVFAVHQHEGRTRHGKITIGDYSLYLHSLQDQLPSPHAVTVQVDEVVPAAPPCLVFLDLAWPGSAPRRVLIRLSPNTPRGRQFLWLCTGQRGPCYANTRLWRVFNKGGVGECVYGGDYEYNNGTGGAALLPDLDTGDYRWSDKAGDVFWCGLNSRTQGAEFRINTRNGLWIPMFKVFGQVVSGLEVLTAAVEHSPIMEVTVVDCGVVLWE